MKKIISISLSLLILFLCSCSQSQDSIEVPADFYYIVSSHEGQSKTDVFRKEIRETKQFNGDLIDVLDLYLKGPESHDLQNIFPDGTQVISIDRNDKAVFVVLSDQFSSLSGLNLSLAGACLCYTVFELTDAHVLNISCESASLEGRSSITMVRENLLTFDDATIPATTK